MNDTCPVCGLDESEWDHEVCEQLQQVERYDGNGGD